MEYLWPEGPVFEQSPEVFPLGTDSLLLADFVRPSQRARILDLGTGSGLLTLLLLWERPDIKATAIDILPEACALARKNLTCNGLGDRAAVLETDLRNLQVEKSYDVVISNPPYFLGNSGPATHRSIARSELTCTLEELCATSARVLREGGSFCLVYRPERLSELFIALRKHRLEPKRIRPVHHSPALPVNLVLMEARLGAAPSLSWEPDLYLYSSDGCESPEYKRICRCS